MQDDVLYLTRLAMVKTLNRLTPWSCWSAWVAWWVTGDWDMAWLALRGGRSKTQPAPCAHDCPGCYCGKFWNGDAP